MSCDMCAAAVRPANMGRPEMHPTAAACPEAYSAAVPAKPATMSAEACEVSSTTIPTPPRPPPPPATPPATTAPATAGVCFECEKRHDDEQHRGNASASRQHQPYGAAGLGAPHRRGRLSPRTKSF